MAVPRSSFESGLGRFLVGEDSGINVNTGATAAPSVRQGAVQVRGRFPSAVDLRIVRQRFDRYRACYELGLHHDQSLKGRVTVSFTIDPRGAAVKARDDGSDLPYQVTVSCVVDAFKGLNFPAPEGGSVDVVYSLVFAPPSATAAPADPDAVAPHRAEP
ncbi:AgmX/PglI C-terminal domain-containing protein [Sorangium sp. So ce363]|uniref:AgmX/PglI C-terminal domain-containing protein n=1 Tax=Sorangium sp. So ce363 TaxID=3133304 RepID=UPI003F6148D4